MGALRPPAAAGPLRRPGDGSHAYARRLDGPHETEIHPLHDGRHPRDPRRRTAAVWLEAARAEERGHRDDARGGHLQFDAGRRFRAQPPRTDEIRDQQAIRRTGTGSRRGDRLRRRRNRTAADHLRLPHGQSLRQTDFALDGLRAGNVDRQGAVAGRDVLFERQRRFARHHPHHRRRGSRGQRDAGRRTGRRAGYPDLHDRHRHARRRPDRDRRGVHQGRKGRHGGLETRREDVAGDRPDHRRGLHPRHQAVDRAGRDRTRDQRHGAVGTVDRPFRRVQRTVPVPHRDRLLDRRNPLLARFNIFREQRTDTDNYNPYNR